MSRKDKWLVHCETSQGVYTYETNREPPDLSSDDDTILKKDHKFKVAHYSSRNPVGHPAVRSRSMNLDLANKSRRK